MMGRVWRLLGARGLTVAALVVGSVPGFVLSFLIVVFKPIQEADAFLLANTASLLGIGVFASAVEAAVIAAASRELSHSRAVGHRALWSVAMRALVQFGPPSLASFFVVAWAFSVTSGGAVDFLALAVQCAPFALVPVVACASAVWSGYLVGRGSVIPVMFSTIFRGAPTLALLLALNPSILVLSASFLVGEMLRLLMLWGIASRHTATGDQAPSALPFPRTRALWAQALSQSLAQVNSLVGRFFILSGPVGSASVGEVAHRVYQAGLQVTNGAIVLPSLSRMPEVFTGDAAQSRRLIRGRVAVIGGSSAALAALGIAAAGGVALWLAPTEPELSRGLAWALALLASLPVAALAIWAARALILSELQPYLVVSSLVGLAATVITGFALVGPLGAFSGILASIAGQLAGAVVGLGVVYARSARYFRS